jgi:DNA mismatch repair protein MutS2
MQQVMNKERHLQQVELLKEQNQDFRREESVYLRDMERRSETNAD